MESERNQLLKGFLVLLPDLSFKYGQQSGPIKEEQRKGSVSPSSSRPCAILCKNGNNNNDPNSIEARLSSVTHSPVYAFPSSTLHKSLYLKRIKRTDLPYSTKPSHWSQSCVNRASFSQGLLLVGRVCLHASSFDQTFPQSTVCHGISSWPRGRVSTCMHRNRKS